MFRRGLLARKAFIAAATAASTVGLLSVQFSTQHHGGASPSLLNVSLSEPKPSVGSSLDPSSSSSTTSTKDVNKNRPRRVAVIGSGIGGSSTASFLHNLDPSIEIHVFEKEDRLGGRLMSIKV